MKYVTVEVFWRSSAANGTYSAHYKGPYSSAFEKTRKLNNSGETECKGWYKYIFTSKTGYV